MFLSLNWSFERLGIFYSTGINIVATSTSIKSNMMVLLYFNTKNKKFDFLHKIVRDFSHFIGKNEEK